MRLGCGGDVGCTSSTGFLPRDHLVGLRVRDPPRATSGGRYRHTLELLFTLTRFPEAETSIQWGFSKTGGCGPSLSTCNLSDVKKLIPDAVRAILWTFRGEMAGEMSDGSAMMWLARSSVVAFEDTLYTVADLGDQDMKDPGNKGGGSPGGPGETFGHEHRGSKEKVRMRTDLPKKSKISFGH